MELPPLVITPTERDSLCMKGKEWKACGRAQIFCEKGEDEEDYVDEMESVSKKLLKELNRNKNNTLFVLDSFSTTVGGSSYFEFVLTPIEVFEPENC